MPTHSDISGFFASRKARRPVRVAMLVANMGLGDARVMKEAETLVAAGHEVTVFCLASAGRPREEVQAGVVYRRCSEPHRKVAAGAGVANAKAARRASVFARLKGAAEPFLRNELIAAAFTRPAIAARPQIIHAHDFETVTAALRVARATGARVIYDMHELEEGRHPAPGPILKRFKMAIEGHAHGRIAASITTSPSYAAEKARLYDIPRPALILNGPRLDRISASGRTLRERCGIPAETPLATYIGLVSGGRGIETLLAAMGHVPAMHLALLGTVRAEMEPAMVAARAKPSLATGCICWPRYRTTRWFPTSRTPIWAYAPFPRPASATHSACPTSCWRCPWRACPCWSPTRLNSSAS